MAVLSRSESIECYASPLSGADSYAGGSVAFGNKLARLRAAAGKAYKSLRMTASVAAKHLKAGASAAVSSFRQTLREMAAVVDRESVEDTKLAEMLATFRVIVRDRVEALGENLQAMLARAEWDLMNVGLFGETQHGKSTLLESLTRGDGASIGTGRKDHTREVNARSIRGMRILDMPGIEGDEQAVIEQIAIGVQRSHVILHIIPAAKAPERLTLERVREHLRNEVLVYAVINVFGAPGDFRDRVPLRELKAEQIAEIERSFREQVGSAFQGSFVIAGRLAHATAARGEFAEKIRKDRTKTLGAFPSLLAARRYSGLSELERGLRDLRRRHFPQLPVLATLRIARELDHALDEVTRRSAAIFEPIDQVTTEVRALPEQIDAEIHKTLSELKAETGRIVDEHRNRAIELTTKAVWEGHQRERVETALDRVLSSCREAIEAETQQRLGELRTRINRRVSRLSRRIDLMADLAEFSGDIDLTSVFSELRVTFRYVLGEITDVILSILGTIALFILNPILGIIGGVISVARKLWDWSRGDPHRRKREASEKAVGELEGQFGILKRRCIHGFESGANKLRKETRTQCAALTDVAERLTGFKRTLESAVLRLRCAKMQLSTAIIGYVQRVRTEPFGDSEASLRKIPRRGIAERAFALAENRRRQGIHATPEGDWLEAERQLRAHLDFEGEHERRAARVETRANQWAYLDARNKRMIVLSNGGGPTPKAATMDALPDIHVISLDRRAHLRQATFSDKQCPSAWQELAREFADVLDFDSEQ